LSQRGRYAEALPVWREAAAVLPENGNVQANLAWAMDCVGEYEEAAKLVEHLGGPPRPALLLVRARVALGARDPRRTLETLRSLDESGWADRPELARRRWKLSGLAHDALEQWDEAAADFRRTLSSSAPALPQLPPLDQATGDLLRKHAAEPDLQDPQIAAPILLTGLPGSGAGRLATMLGDQEQLVVRRNRTGLDTGFLPLEEPAQRLSQSDLETLHWRYARPLRRSGLPDDALIIDWLPYLDARALPALKRALPGLRILKVQCDPRDALLNWLAFANAELLMPDPLAAARWLKAAATHLALAEELLPVFNVDLEAVQANREGPEGKALAAFLGLELLRSGPLQDAMEKRLRGMPATFHPGHADRYREALAEAFAALE
jgi:tetratricopeptide (TPR) repeat protein